MKKRLSLRSEGKGNAMELSGVSKRWIRTTMTVVVTVLFIFFILLFFVARNYYYSSVELKLNSQYTTSVSNYFTASDKTPEMFESAAQEYVEKFDQKDLMEVWIYDKSGNVIVSSSGFAVKDPYAPDYKEALRSPTRSATYTGKDAAGEKIKSATYLFYKGNENTGAVRYIISMRQVNRQLVMIFIAIMLVYAVIVIFFLYSGMFFVQSIVTPVTQMNEVTKQIASGDLTAKLEPQGYHDEISELCENINNMSDELKSAEKMKNDFISTVSHEMKTPLTAIKGWAETLLNMGNEDPALFKRGMEVIIDESSRLTGVVEDLLDLSKIANGRMKLKNQRIDVLAELDQTIFVFKERSMREGIELSYNAPHLPAPADGDPERLDQVFINILDNAFKYTEQGGKIKVVAAIRPPAVEGDLATLSIKVKDTGCGISEEELPNVKKKFYKSNISVKGSGIGLAVCDEIVRMHNGTMKITSELGAGTCVTLEFPVEYIEEPEDTALAEALKEAEEKRAEEERLAAEKEAALAAEVAEKAEAERERQAAEALKQKKLEEEAEKERLLKEEEKKKEKEVDKEINSLFEKTLQMIENDDSLTPEEKRIAREQLAAEVGPDMEVEMETDSEGNDTEA